MIFGDAVGAADTIAPAEWLGASCHGDPWTVGALVPNQYPSVLRVYPPAPCPGDWWALYRDLFHVVASIGERHTTSPERAWFAIWEGHGFDKVTSHIAHYGPLGDDARRALERERVALRDEDRRRNTAIRDELDQLPRFDRPDRAYYLLKGPVAAVTELRDPGSSDEWRNPDLFWPADRRWFVATDVDFWSLYVGGENTFTNELAGAVPTRSEPVEFDHPLETED